MKLGVLARKAVPGTTVTLHLSPNEAISGELTEVQVATPPEYVCLRVHSGEVIFFEDRITGFTLHAPQAAQVPMSPQPPQETRVVASEAAFAAAPKGPPLAAEFAATEDVHSTSTLARIAERINECIICALRVRRAVPAPSFAVPAGDFDPSELTYVRQLYNAAQNSYQYAHKINELKRLRDVHSRFVKPLVSLHSQKACVHFLSGCLLMEIGSTSAALDALSKAAHLSDDPEHWRVLAAAARNTDDDALACYVLRRMFLKTPPGGDLWYVYLRLVREARDFPGFAEVVQAAASRADTSPAEASVLVESLIDLLLAAGRPDTSRELLQILSRSGGRMDSFELARVVGVLSELRSSRSDPAEMQEADDRRSEPLVREGQTVEKGAADRPPADYVDKPSSLEVATEVQGRAIAPPMGPAIAVVRRFGELLFGFLEKLDDTSRRTPTRDMLYFRLEDVEHSELAAQLRAHKLGQMVVCDQIPAPGSEYHRAVRIDRWLEVPDLLRRAHRLFHEQQHLSALRDTRLVLRHQPAHAEAAALEERILNLEGPLAPRSSASQDTEQLYQQAKNAHQNGRMAEAESLFRRVIEKGGDRFDSAVKDLASIRQQLGKVDEAIAILRQHRNRVHSPESVDNMMATIFQHAGRHQEALTILNALRDRLRGAQLGKLLSRIAFTLTKLGRYGEAQETLKNAGKLHFDPATKWALSALERAVRSGGHKEVDHLFGFAEFARVLSTFAQRMIEGCRFQGVDPIRLRERKISRRDVNELEEAVKDATQKKPQDRAALFLSAAVLVRDFNLEEDTTLFLSYLRRYFASMGDFALSERKHRDVVQAYYTESLNLTFEVQNEALYALSRYMLSVDEVSPKVSRNYILPDQALEELLPRQPPQLLPALCYVTVRRPEIARYVTRMLHKQRTKVPRLASFLGLADLSVLENFRRAWEERRQQMWQRLEWLSTELASLELVALDATSMEHLYQRLSDLVSYMQFDLDRQRMDALRQLSGEALRFCQATTFRDRDVRQTGVQGRATRILADIRENPTKLSLEYMLPLIEHIRDLIEERFADILKSAPADVRIELTSKSYVAQKDRLRLQVTIKNGVECSPASDIRVLISSRNSPYFRTESAIIPIQKTLFENESTDEHVPLELTSEALVAGAFPIDLAVAYRDRSNRIVNTEARQFPVRLTDPGQFKELRNRYAALAETSGVPLSEKDMFVGRDKLIEKMLNSLLRSPGKSILMFGQKRAGKTAVLEHLQPRLLESDMVPIKFSLLRMALNLTESRFLKLIVDSVASGLQKHPRWQTDPLAWDPEITSSDADDPVESFSDAMTRLQRLMSTSRWRDSRIVLLIDEFTQIYKLIKKGDVKPEFMKIWRFIMDERWFSAVLVGQDIMADFRLSFANEFGNAEDERIDYLTRDDTEMLIDRGIGCERFMGNALPRIYELTAGSPYYTVIVCNHLVNYINDDKVGVITEADVNLVIREKLLGQLQEAHFDGLLYAGDKETDPVRSTRSLCQHIARESQNGWISGVSVREAIPGAEQVLEDLVVRRVLERNEHDSYRLKVALFREWLMAPRR